MVRKEVFGVLPKGRIKQRTRTSDYRGDGGNGRCPACGGEGRVGIMDPDSKVAVGGRARAIVVGCPICGDNGSKGKDKKGDWMMFFKPAEAG